MSTSTSFASRSTSRCRSESARSAVIAPTNFPSMTMAAACSTMVRPSNSYGSVIMADWSRAVSHFFLGPW